MKLSPIENFIKSSNNKNLMNKTVECVMEIRNRITPTLILWSGETTDGYFRVALLGGTVMMTFSEREYQIKFGLVDGVYIGGLDFILNKLVKTKTENDLMSYISDIDTLNQLAEETKTVQFQDVMSLLNWEFKNDKIEVEKPEFSLV